MLLYYIEILFHVVIYGFPESYNVEVQNGKTKCIYIQFFYLNTYAISYVVYEKMKYKTSIEESYVVIY